MSDLDSIDLAIFVYVGLVVAFWLYEAYVSWSFSHRHRQWKIDDEDRDAKVMRLHDDTEQVLPTEKTRGTP